MTGPLSPDPPPIEQALRLGERRGVRLEVGWWQGVRVMARTRLSDDPWVRQQFEREAAIAARLHHPQLVTLLERSERRLLLHWRDGLPLRTVLRGGPLDLGCAVNLARGLLEAAGGLHAAGVTHHDLKPENVLIADWRPGRPLSAQQVVLLDYDLSYAADLPDVPAHCRMGTPHYMAPEQFAGQRGDPRSDLYSAGAVLHEALTGAPPYEDALRWLLGQLPARRSWPQTGALEPLVGRLLQREPQERPASAQVALQWLEAAPVRLDAAWTHWEV